MYLYSYNCTLSLEICLEYKLKVLLQSQTISYYIVCIDIKICVISVGSNLFFDSLYFPLYICPSVVSSDDNVVQFLNAQCILRDRSILLNILLCCDL